jgi:hypothetical protein
VKKSYEHVMASTMALNKQWQAQWRQLNNGKHKGAD